jgi:hypothetical protein
MRRLFCVLTAAVITIGGSGRIAATKPETARNVEAQPDAAPGAIIFLNRNGGVYRSGFDNPAINTSPILLGQQSVSSFAGDDTDWDHIVRRVRARYARFNIAVVDEEPAPPARYIEVVVGRTPGEAGFESNVGGVAPLYCSPVQNSIVFVFAALYGNDVSDISAVIDHETGHAFSLDHAFSCKDPMTYLTGCGEKVFVHEDAACGEFSARQCFCGGATQNSVQTLLNAFGSHDGSVQALDRDPMGELAGPAAYCTQYRDPQ